MKSHRFYLVSLGCAKNLVDSEKITAVMEQHGYKLTMDPSSADILIVNTCGFIKDAVEESVETILELAEIKKINPEVKLVVSGCMVQRYREMLAEELPEVDLFVGTREFFKIPELLKKKRKISIKRPRYEAWEIPRKLLTHLPTAYLKIAEGCSANCTFCIIPKLRGPQVSRDIPSLIEEAKWLESQGVKELIVISQDTTAYGRDLKDGTNLIALLRELLDKTDFHWIRLQYLYPESYPEEFFSLFKNSPLLPYFDIPIQHISDRILKMMNRRSDSKTIRKLMEEIKSRIPEAIIRTTVIVGFPGETDREFNELLTYLEESPIDFFGAFKFSAEEGTRASRLPNQVPEEVKEERLDIINRIAWEKLDTLYSRLEGSTMEVLIEEDWDRDFFIGRAWFQGPDADGSILVKKDEKTSPPLFTDVKILNEVSEFDGEVVSNHLSTGTK